LVIEPAFVGRKPCWVDPHQLVVREQRPEQAVDTPDLADGLGVFVHAEIEVGDAASRAVDEEACRALAAVLAAGVAARFNGAQEPLVEPHCRAVRGECYTLAGEPRTIAPRPDGFNLTGR